MATCLEIGSEFSFRNFTGKGIKVGVVDSGINACHSHVRRVEGGVRIGLNARGEVVFEDDYNDYLGHGTAIAGVISKKAPDAELYSVKIFDRILSAPALALAKAIEWVVDNGIKVANLSLGLANKAHVALLRRVCHYAQEKGVILVAARDREDREIYPADFHYVLSVVSDERCGEDDSLLFYQDGNRIRFIASPWPRELPGLPQKYNLKGNSFAAAHVSGFVALILQKYPSADLNLVRQILVECSGGNLQLAPKSREKRD
jgi:subtilisin family serine protease